MADDTRTLTATATVHAPAAALFAVLADPARHPELDDTGMVRGAVGGARITGVGDVFTMAMRLPESQREYRTENHVVEFEPDRAIGWAPGGPGRTPAGHTFTWRLEPDPDAPDARTVVTQVYDWSRFTHLDHLDDLPVASREQLTTSIRRLAAAVGADVDTGSGTDVGTETGTGTGTGGR